MSCRSGQQGQNYRSTILSTLVVVVLLAASNAPLRYSEDPADRQLFEDIPTCPRFILQPSVAILLGSRDGVRMCEGVAIDLLSLPIFCGMHPGAALNIGSCVDQRAVRPFAAFANRIARKRDMQAPSTGAGRGTLFREQSRG